jgi:hypothetical protein
MAQRILIATCLIMVLACFALVGFVWSESHRWSQANLVLIEQAQRTNQAILKQLETLSRSQQSAPRVSDWIPVAFRLSLEKSDGPAAVGYEIRIGRGEGGSDKDDAIRRLTDEGGRADFGVVQPGDWEYRITAACDETRYWNATSNFNAVPGSVVAKEIICPKAPPDRASVNIRVAWPAELSGKDLRLIALFRHNGVTYKIPLWWSLRNPQDQKSIQSREILCGPGSRQVELGAENYPLVWRPARENEMVNVYKYGGPEKLTDSNRVYADLGPASEASGSGPIDIDAGAYALERLIILGDGDASKANEAGRIRFEVYAIGGDPPLRLAVRQAPSVWGSFYTGVQSRSSTPFLSSSRTTSDRFEALPGKTAEWTITLPDELAKEIRSKLKGQK